MYNTYKGFYIIPVGLSYLEYKQVRNLFTLILRSHSILVANIISSFQESLDRLCKKISISINKIIIIVSAFIMVFTSNIL